MMVVNRINKVNVDLETYRMVVISDIHGHINPFEQLLKQVSLKNEDYLVILGDFLEKGPDCKKILERMRALKERPNTFIVLGNCEAHLVSLLIDEKNAEKLVSYLKNVPWPSLLKDTVRSLKLKIDDETPLSLQTKLREALKDELEFLQSLDTAVVFDQFVFAHAGVENRVDWENSSSHAFLEQLYFMDQGHQIEGKYVVCGHMPTSNYSDTDIDNSIIINHRKRIISIDGGLGVKMMCQLNALVIQKEEEGYLYLPYRQDTFDHYEVLFKSYPKFVSTVKIAWPNTEIEVLQIGTSFAWARKLATNELCFIKNEFIHCENNRYYCHDDYVSKMIEAQPGDIVSLVKTYGKYAYVMKNGVVGWIKLDRLKKVSR